MISVTQPRKPADDFLASLQANLQRQPRRRGREQPVASKCPPKTKNEAVKAQTNAKPPPRASNKVKPSESAVKDASGRRKANQPQNNGPIKALSPKGKAKPPAVLPTDVKHYGVNVHMNNNPPATISQDFPVYDTSVPNTHQLIPQNMIPPVVTSNYAPDSVVPAQSNQFFGQEEVNTSHQPAITRQSKNNFYSKNQSNIFQNDWPQENVRAVPRSRDVGVRDSVAVQNALKIASQQPLPAPPSFSTPRNYDILRQDQSIPQQNTQLHNSQPQSIHQQNTQPQNGQLQNSQLQHSQMQNSQPPNSQLQNSQLRNSQLQNNQSQNIQQHSDVRQNTQQQIIQPQNSQQQNTQQTLPSNTLQNNRNNNMKSSAIIQPEVISSPVEAKPYNSHYCQSFSITGGHDNDSKMGKELERRKWIQELEDQIKEKKMREQNEKLRDRSPHPFPQQTPQGGFTPQQNHPSVQSQQNYTQQAPPPSWPTQQAPPQTYPTQSSSEQSPYLSSNPTQNSLGQANMPQRNSGQDYLSQQNIVQANMPNQNSGQANLALQNSQNSMPNAQRNLLSRQSSTDSSSQARKLGQNSAMVDPVELDRRQEARKRALENQETIRKQVEDRERLRKEEKDQIRREEEFEMKKIEDENKRMAAEVMAEQQKARKREAEQMKQIADMRQKIEEANRSAKESKQRKRDKPESPFPNRQLPADIHEVENKVNHFSRGLNSQDSKEADNSNSHAVKQTHNQSVEVSEQVRSRQTIQKASDTDRAVSSVCTQTINEVSCQTVPETDSRWMMKREDSFLAADSRLIQLKDRELSIVQKSSQSKQTSRADLKTRNLGRNKTNQNSATNKKAPKKGDITKSNQNNERAKNAVKRNGSQQKPEKPKSMYDENGRRIRQQSPTVEKVQSKPMSPPSNIIAEESVAITGYKSVAEIFDHPEPTSAPLELESLNPSPFTVEQSPYTVPEQQIQMRYTSPNNEQRSIPAAISARQNDILGQLEKLRMGLKHRRKEMSSSDEIATH